MSLRTPSVLDDLDRCLKAEQMCIELTNEFLACHEFSETMTVFRNEVQRSTFAPPKTSLGKPRVKRENVRHLLALFESLDHNSFFKSWDSLIPEQIKEKSEYKKLTIYLYTFFVTLPYGKQERVELAEKPSPVVVDSLDKVTNLNGTFVLEKPSFEKMLFIDSTPDEITSPADTDKHLFESDSLDETDSKRNSPEVEPTAMAIFKQFLLDHGSEFTNEPELLPYFALPFVENPRHHPTFTRVFEKEWSEHLKHSLRAFLVKYSCGSAVVPDMVRMCIFQSQGWQQQGRNDHSKKVAISESKDDARDQLVLKDLKRKLHILKRDHQKLVGVATELATAMEKCVQGEAVDINSILSNCMSIFPDLFSPTPQAVHEKVSKRGTDSFSKSNELKLDASKIKTSLLEGSIKVQLLLLQALRWRMTRSATTNERHLFLDWFCKTDILGLNDGLFGRLLLEPFESPHPLQQSLTRLTNALVSTKMGRSYLTSSGQAIESLVNFAKDRDLDVVTEEMLAAIFYKISERESTCEMMNSNNMVEWIGIVLEKPLKPKAVEQVILLLNNLTLTLSPDYWDNREKFADAIMRLLEHPEEPIASYACFTLSSILKNDRLNDYCKNMRLDMKLNEFLVKSKDNSLRAQVEELVMLHKREISACKVPFSLPKIDTDTLDTDIDDNDLVKESPNGDFLKEKYSTDDVK